MAIVFIVQQTLQSRDFSSAVKYGPIKFLLDITDRPSVTPELCFNKLKSSLRKFNPSEDYLVCAGGDPVSPLMVGMVLGQLGKNDVQYLRWERSRDENGYRGTGGFYVPSRLLF